jgi:hypothetical protein
VKYKQKTIANSRSVVYKHTRLNVDQGPRRLCPTVFLQNRKWEAYFVARGLRQNSWVVENQLAEIICCDGQAVAVKYIEIEESHICGAKHYKNLQI